MPANSFSNTIEPYSTVLIHRQLSDFQLFIDLMTNRWILHRIRIRSSNESESKNRIVEQL